MTHVENRVLSFPFFIYYFQKNFFFLSAAQAMRLSASEVRTVKRKVTMSHVVVGRVWRNSLELLRVKV
jgi:hypothetical protein